jgi:hypothetical protein
VKDKYTALTLLQGLSRDGLYPIFLQNKPFNKGRSPTTFLGVSPDLVIWHNRLGHPASSVLAKLRSLGHLSVLRSAKHESIYESCLLAKSKCLPFTTSNNVTTAPLELIHSDLWSSPISSLSGCRYYVIFIDNFSRFSWIYPMHKKSETFDYFVKFKCLAKNMISQKIKSFQSNGEGEFISNKFSQFLKPNGIIHRISCPYIAQQNGLAERKHRHVVETGLALLAQSKLPTFYWVDAFNTSVYLINRMPSPVLQNKCPYSKLLQKNPDYSLLRVFGCTCYPLLRPYSSHKLIYRSKKCIFLGYISNYRGYRCLDLTSKRIYTSRHVVFDEENFPAHGWNSSLQPATNGHSPVTSPLQGITIDTTPLSPQVSTLPLSMSNIVHSLVNVHSDVSNPSPTTATDFNTPISAPHQVDTIINAPAQSASPLNTDSSLLAEPTSAIAPPDIAA